MSDLSDKIRKTAAFRGRRSMVAVRRVRWELGRRSLERPIFVVGCSRAGTTLVYKTLSESTEIGSLNRETHDFWAGLHPLSERHWATHVLSASDASATDRDVVSRYFMAETGRSRIVDKNNQNGLCVAYLYALFPDAQFVYVKRSPGDNLHSLIEGWGRADEFATWSAELPARLHIDGGRYSRWCFFLFTGWRNFTNASIERVCAEQYRAMNRAILDAAESVPKDQWIEIRYEDLVHDPVGQFRSVFESCGLAFTPALRAHCETVLSTPYNAFSEIRVDKWRDQSNRERIERVLPGLKNLAVEMGYPS